MTGIDPTKLIQLPADGYGRAGEVLGRAFQEDPLWQATFLDSDRSKSLVAMFTAVVRAITAAQGIAETTTGVDAVALWLPPGKDLGRWSVFRSGFALPRFAIRLPASDRKRMMRVLRQLDTRKKALIAEPHWYLAAVGVDPAWQGEGLGSRLVLSGIRRAEEANVPVYLETETEGNVGFYEHLGFDVIEQVTAVGLELPIWLMVRLPVAGN